MTRFLASLGLTLTALLTLTACGGDSNTQTKDNETTSKTELSIPFAARSGTTDIACDTALPALGSNSVEGQIKYFAYYIHDIELLDNNGSVINSTLTDNAFQDPDEKVVFLQYQNKDTTCSGDAQTTYKQVSLSLNRDQVSAVASLRFKIGVPFEINHADPANAKSIYTSADYKWGWQNGRKFVRLDVKPAGGVFDGNGVSKGDTRHFHLGSTGCEADANGKVTSCSNPNRPTIQLDNFSLNDSPKTVILNYQNLVANVAFNQDTGGQVGCMSGATDPECPDMFSALGLRFQTDNGQTTAVNDGTQTLFSLE